MIAFLFIAGMTISVLLTLTIHREHNSLADIIQSSSVDKGDGSKISALIRKIAKKSEENEDVDIENILRAYSLSLLSPCRYMKALAGILVTTGLIGTIIGLIGAIDGLESALTQVGDTDGIKAAMVETIGGMGTAFYTTLIGALFGGVFLKMLSAVADASVEKLNNEAFSFIALEVTNFESGQESARILARIEQLLERGVPNASR